MAAFTVLARDRAELAELLRDAHATRSSGLMEGRPPETRDPAYPPTDSGTARAEPAAPDDLTVVVSVGASLFDDRYGLADRAARASW